MGKKKIVTAQCGCEMSGTKKVIQENTCRDCQGLFCDKHIGQYVDESNISITKNSPMLCLACYSKRYKR